MGWNSISDTANRRSNLADLNNAQAQLTSYKDKLTPVVAQLAAAEGVIDHLVDIDVCTNRELIQQFEIASKALSNFKNDTEEALATVNALSAEYSVPRKLRAPPQQSGYDMAKFARMVTFGSNVEWNEFQTLRNSTLSQNLRALANSSNQVNPQEKATLTRLADSLRNLG